MKSPSLPDWPIVEGAEGVVLIVGRGMEVEVVARTKSAIITVGEETTIMTIARVKPSLNLERTMMESLLLSSVTDYVWLIQLICG